MLFKKQKHKYFCIGHNKTGTTTIEKVFKDFGYTLGNQVKGELLLDAWFQRDFKTIVNFCKTAEAFQDVPFSLPYTYQFLENSFKEAKFILTIRDNADQWYNSLTKFHSKLWADGKTIPTTNIIKNVSYRYKGYTYKALQNIYNSPKDDLYNKEILIQFYNNYNKEVIEYFRSKPEKLIIINVSNSSDYAKLCKFLNKPNLKADFPWENKTSN